MKCYRIVDPPFSKPADILSGNGAQKFGGRWNKKGRRAINSSGMPETAIAEKAFYRFLPNVEIFLEQASGGRNPPKVFLEKVNGIPLKMATIEISDSVQYENLADQTTLNQHLANSRLPLRSVNETRYSPYHSLPGKWTQSLSEHIFGISQGIKALSARSNCSSNFIWFSEKLETQDASIVDIEDIFLFPCDSTGTQTTNPRKIVRDKVLVARGSNNFAIDILTFSMPQPYV